MKNKIILLTSIIFVVIVLFSNFIFAADKTKEIEIKSDKIDYLFPYPGILPDNFLYPVKNIRDMIWLFVTRDYVKKAKVYHLIADKKALSSQMLAQKGKWNASGDIIKQSQDDFLQAVVYSNKAKKQGSLSDDAFIQKMKLSAQKHQEIIEDLIKNTSESDINSLKTILQVNKKIQNLLNRL